jgi:hypothetical protein
VITIGLIVALGCFRVLMSTGMDNLSPAEATPCPALLPLILGRERVLIVLVSVRRLRVVEQLAWVHAEPRGGVEGLSKVVEEGTGGGGRPSSCLDLDGAVPVLAVSGESPRRAAARLSSHPGLRGVPQFCCGGIRGRDAGGRLVLAGDDDPRDGVRGGVSASAAAVGVRPEARRQPGSRSFAYGVPLLSCPGRRALAWRCPVAVPGWAR